MLALLSLILKWFPLSLSLRLSVSNSLSSLLNLSISTSLSCLLYLSLSRSLCLALSVSLSLSILLLCLIPYLPSIFLSLLFLFYYLLPFFLSFYLSRSLSLFSTFKRFFVCKVVKIKFQQKYTIVHTFCWQDRSGSEHGPYTLFSKLKVFFLGFKEDLIYLFQNKFFV